ncbi:MAG: choice-of-anchor L domain-containing protein [Crocinitomicaceae bacterium]|nr:choice-of-anchor L domain-containing protein [Crocinitomicaceae bacterium]
MEASAQVECGETYHLVISIADAGDGAYDSGIFLEANSLASFSPIQMNATLANNVFGNQSTMAEGCETATVTITRSATAALVAQTIPIIVSGSATEGTDYTNIPASVSFAAGQTTATISIEAFQDMIAEGNLVEYNLFLWFGVLEKPRVQF